MSTQGISRWQTLVVDNTLYIRVTPNASANAIKAVMQDDKTLLLRVYVTTAAEDGKANEAALKLLAKALNVSKSSLTITHGTTSRDKKIHINR